VVVDQAAVCVRVGDAQVQQQWYSYTEKVDHMVEEAFRLNVKWSLQELSRAINGDGKSGANPLFRVQVVLQNDKVRSTTYFLLRFVTTSDGVNTFFQDRNIC